MKHWVNLKDEHTFSRALVTNSTYTIISIENTETDIKARSIQFQVLEKYAIFFRLKYAYKVYASFKKRWIFINLLTPALVFPPRSSRAQV